MSTKIYKVCIDPGHGGSDGGATRIDGGREADDNLRIARAIRNELTMLRVECVMTRDSDINPSRNERLAIGEACDIAISCHRNSFDGIPSKRGFESWVWSKSSSDTRKFASDMAIAIERAGMLLRPTPVGIGHPDGPTYDFWFNNSSNMQPSILLEFGYVKVAEDNAEFDNNLPAIAQAVANEIALKLLEMANVNDNPFTGGGTTTRTVTVSYTEGGITKTTQFPYWVYDRVQMVLGTSRAISPLLEPVELFNQDIHWTSSNLRVATVSQSGVADGIGEGTCIITAAEEESGYEACCTVDVVACDYEVTALSATEIVRGERKDIVVTATYRNNTALLGEATVKLLYGSAEYISENIMFHGIIGQRVTRSYTIKDLPLNAQHPIEARINYNERNLEINPHDNFKALPPLAIPIPRNDYTILFIKAFQDFEIVNIDVAYQNLSYQSGSVPVRVRYDNGNYLDDTVSFSGIPFETVVRKYTGQTGSSGLQKPVEALINWDNRASEENVDNNRMICYVDIEGV